jgi:hypothetical protein
MVHKDPFSLIVGDFNRDGVPDIAVLTTYPSGAVKILLGNADGTFRPGASYATEVGFYGAAASLRGNGTLDLIFGGAGMDDVYVMLGNGDGTFQLPVAYPVTAASQMIALGEFTGDGKLDVVSLEGTSSQGVVCDCVEVLPETAMARLAHPLPLFQYRTTSQGSLSLPVTSITTASST